METIAAVGYVIASVYHLTDITNLPIPVVGLAWLIAVRFIPAVVDPIGLFWVTYAFLTYQLISFHDLNACLLDACATTDVFSGISLASTVIFWLTMKDTSQHGLKVEPPVIRTEKKTFPELKIRINSVKTRPGPIRLNMGDSLQPRWV